MKWLVPAIIIGFVGGILDKFTELHKIWCFLIGVAAFFIFVLIKSIFITARIRKQTKGEKGFWLDPNNNIVRMD